MAVNKKTGRQEKTGAVEKINEMFGKVPPQEIELERAVLGALLIQSDAIDSVIDVLVPDSFYEPAHQMIYKSIIDLGTAHKPVDIITVAYDLKVKEQIDIIGGEVYLSELTDRVATASHLEFHSRIVHQKYIQRELIKIASNIQKRSYDDSQDIEELINFAEGEIFNVSSGNIKNQTQQVNSLVEEAIGQAEEAARNKDKLLGVPSGFTGIDRITSGWQPADMIIVAARPSMGKTAFVLSMARNMSVEHNRPVALFSLEMSSLQLVNRLMSSESEIESGRIRRGNLQEYEWQQLKTKVDALKSSPMFIDDTPAISIFELRAKCRRLKQMHDIQAVIIDYLQLMTAGTDMKGNREQEVSVISRSLKAIAKELKIPIIALSQLNRSVESRSGDKRPQLSDLRESGAIEQDADMVLFINRPEYYGLTVDEDGNSLVGMAEIIIAKHRNGAVGSVMLKFKKEFAKFTDLPLAEDGFAFESKMNDVSVEESNIIPVNDDFMGFDENNPPF